jgi:uncharacterized protein
MPLYFFSIRNGDYVDCRRMVLRLRQGIALDPSGWQPLVEAHPDWFEVIHLYGTESGWDRLKKISKAHGDADARHEALVDLIAPAARNIHAYWLAAALLRGTPWAIRDDRFTRCPFPAATTHAPGALARSSDNCHGPPKSLH